MKKLVIFNLRTDPASSVLGASIDWIEAFRDHFLVTDVVSTHVGKNVDLENVKILELGGGSTGARVKAVFRLFKFAIHIIRRRKEYLVFHHMSPRTAVFPGLLFMFFGIPQGLWYSHSSRPFSLRLSARIVDVIFSSEENSLPLSVQNAHFVGHGISLKRFGTNQSIDSRNNAILFIGRISPIKNLTNLINEVALLGKRLPIVLIGPQSDKKYIEYLRDCASTHKVSLKIKGSVNYSEVHSVMKQFKYFYSGMKNSVDKSALEAAMSGCLVLTTDLGTQELSGMKQAWELFVSDDVTNIHNQIEHLESLGAREINSLQEIVRNQSIRRNSLEDTIARIASIMKASQ